MLFPVKGESKSTLSVMTGGAIVFKNTLRPFFLGIPCDPNLDAL
jgi:hypothetical protein